MKSKTEGHWRTLGRIMAEDGFLTMLDYDWQVTRSRHPTLDRSVGIAYLKTPPVMMIGADGCYAAVSRHYTIRQNEWSDAELVLHPFNPPSNPFNPPNMDPGF